MNAPTTCLSCPSRPTCRSLCALMERRASQDMRHLRGEEVLMAPDGIARVSRRRGADAMRDLVRDAVEIEDLRRIPGLTGKQIRILAMHFVDGKSYRDIGDALGLNQSTIGEHVLAARRKARAWLAARRRAARGLAHRPAAGPAARGAARLVRAVAAKQAAGSTTRG